ncbi:MAG: aldo/keto reductase [Pseudomonadota bacterium]
MAGSLVSRPLGKTGLEVAPLALGTVKLGRDKGVKYPNAFEIPNDQQARDLLREARDLGINLIDTAPAYGNSELRLGTLLADQRDAWTICTKVGEEWVNDTSHYNFTAEHCRMSVERSLTRLQTDRLDIVLVHSDGTDLKILNEHGTLEVLQELKQAGKILQVGISHKTVSGAQRAIALGADVIMATLNQDHRDEIDLIAEASQQGVGVLIKKALRSGHGSARDLSWVAGHAGVHSIVVGTTNPKHLAQNVEVLTRLDD